MSKKNITTEDVLINTRKSYNAIERLIALKKSEIDQSAGIWTRLPVSFIEFCREWIRQPLFHGHQEQLAMDCFQITENDLPKTFTEILLFVGKGGGKGHISAAILTYFAYLILLMKDARSFFKIGRTAPIHLLNVSYNSRQAKDVFFNGYLVPMVRATMNPQTKKNFFEEMGVDLREDNGDIQSNKIFFERPKGEIGSEGGISAESIASDSHSGEGYSPLIVFVDEFSSMKPDRKASDLIDKLETSAESRFGDYRKIIIASYKQGKNCKMSVRYNTALKNQTPNVYLMRAATWEFNRMKEQSVFSNSYLTNPDKARMYYECLDSEGVDEFQFFKRVEKLEMAFPYDDINPFVGDIHTVTSDELKTLVFKDWFKPRQSTKYCIHIDLAKGTQKDRAGLTMSHREGVKELKVEDIDKYINGEIDTTAFKVRADFFLQIKKSKIHNEIIFEDIRKFIYRLRNMGFKLRVTLDGFQSLDFEQQLRAIGIDVDIFSVDRDTKAYDTLLTLIYRDNFLGYYHPILWRELTELEISPNGKKVDHPYQSATRYLEDGLQAGSKDIADSLAGSVYQSLLCPPDSIPIKPMLGISVGHSEDVTAYDFEKQLNGGKIIVSKDTKLNRNHENWNMPFV